MRRKRSAVRSSACTMTIAKGATDAASSSTPASFAMSV
jgi:hypothetical protein